MAIKTERESNLQVISRPVSKIIIPYTPDSADTVAIIDRALRGRGSNKKFTFMPKVEGVERQPKG